MTIKRLLFEGGVDGEDVTNATAGTSLINRAGGIVKFDAAAAQHGLLGLRTESTASAQYTIARATSAAANNQMAFECVFTYTGAGAGGAPAAELNFLMIRNSINDSGVARLVVKTNNGFEVRDGVNTPIPGTTLTAVPGTKYRIALVMTGGSTDAGIIDASLYEGDSLTPIGTWSSTAANLNVNPIGGVELGVISANQAAYVGFDDVQFNDGGTEEIGPYDPAANDPPVVDAGGNQTVSVGTTVNLTSTATDSDGIGSVAWTFDYYPPALGSAPVITGADQNDASFVPTVPGLYVARITATDLLGAQSFDTTRVFVPGLPVTVIADTANPGNWANVGGASALWDAISDDSDTTWAESPESPLAEAAYRARLAPLPVLTNVTLSVRHGLSDAGSGGMAKVRLIEGAAVRKEWVLAPSETLGTVDLTMTPAECAAVTSWNELDLEFSWAV